MTNHEYNKGKQSFSVIHKAVEDELKSFDSWRVWNCPWSLRFAGVMNDGTIQAIVYYGFPKNEIQYVGVSWENVIDRIKTKWK